MEDEMKIVTIVTYYSPMEFYNANIDNASGSGNIKRGDTEKQSGESSNANDAVTSRRNLLYVGSGCTLDDDGLLQDIYNDEGNDDDDEEEDDDEMVTQQTDSPKRYMPLPSTRMLKKPTEAAAKGESDEFSIKTALNSKTRNDELELKVTSDKWESLSTIPQEVKELFPYILKYTPQYIETPYTLQIFIPDYVPSVGDVDAFLKVTTPDLPTQSQRRDHLEDHLSKMGLHFLDEPSGDQSEPSLLNIKLRSILSDPRSASNNVVPTAKTPKDIEKWITEVEQVHMAHLSTYEIRPRKDIDALILDWPLSFADASHKVFEAYRNQRGDAALTEYIYTLCQYFGMEGACETQADYILNIQTLFALYLAASQAWE